MSSLPPGFAAAEQAIERSAFAGTFHKPNHAFGVDPTRRELYSLRQARYDAAADDISRWAGAAALKGALLTVLDVGTKTGTLLRHLEHRPHFYNIRLYGTDVRKYEVYKRHHYREIFISDLETGQIGLPSDAFDVVVCEQVLEHLPRIDLAIASLERVLRPGGKLIVGVPIFIPPLACLRRSYVAYSQKRDPSRSWSHIQTFSQNSFLEAMKRHSDLDLVGARGFRIVSEGLIRPLENYRWWWALNRWLGTQIPFACAEVQAIFSKKTRGSVRHLSSDIRFRKRI